MTLLAFLFVCSAGCLLGVGCFVAGVAFGIRHEEEAQISQDWRDLFADDGRVS